jgi:hypothetical protein
MSEINDAQQTILRRLAQGQSLIVPVDSNIFDVPVDGDLGRILLYASIIAPGALVGAQNVEVKAQGILNSGSQTWQQFGGLPGSLTTPPGTIAEAGHTSLITAQLDMRQTSLAAGVRARCATINGVTTSGAWRALSYQFWTVADLAGPVSFIRFEASNATLAIGAGSTFELVYL